MSGPRGLVAVAAATGALVAASPAPAIDLGLRPDFLPPVDGSAHAEAFSLAAKERELIVAVTHDRRAPALLRRHGARRLAEGFWLVQGPSASGTVRQLSRLGALRYAHPNGRVQRSASLARLLGDPRDPEPWWLPRIGGDRVVPPGPGFPLTIVDDGIDTSHPEFRGRRIGFLNDSELIDLEDFHGTAMSSIAAAPQNGVGMVGLYPQAALRLADTGAGDCADVIAALSAAFGAGPSVVNMSWGFSPPTCLSLHDQILKGLRAGGLAVAATGNLRLYLNTPSVPARWPHVLTVGSTGLSGRVSYFSNEGNAIDLAAPGESMIAATPSFVDASGYADLDGTSFSAALVSAAGAWVATRRRMHVTQLGELLRSTAQDVAPAGWDKDTGYGILDLPAALSRPLPSIDPLEPNDDVNQVKAGGLFKDAAEGLTRPGRDRATVRARVNLREDPVDVYRVYAPERRGIRLRVVPKGNVNLELFRANASSCYYANRRQALKGALIGGSYGAGSSVETFELKPVARSRYVYACVFKGRTGPAGASYTLEITTTAAPSPTNR